MKFKWDSFNKIKEINFLYNFLIWHEFIIFLVNPNKYIMSELLTKIIYNSFYIVNIYLCRCNKTNLNSLLNALFYT